MNVLLIEDNTDLANSVIHYLQLCNIGVDYAPNATIALNMMMHNQYLCCVLDINLPGEMNGFQFCQKIRSDGFATPVMMMTARGDIQDKLTGFRAGADDFLVKPVEFAELAARIKVLSKRQSGEVKFLEFGSLKMDFNHHEVTAAGQKLALPPISWKILEILLRHAPYAVEKERLETSIWGKSPPFSGSLKVHLYNLRQILDKSPVNDIILETVRDYGFKLAQIDTQQPN